MVQQRRSFYIVGILLFLSFLIMSCGPEEESAPQMELAPSTVNWVTWEPSSQAEQTLVKQFQELYPQIEFKRESTNAASSVYLTQTPPPDLLNMDVNFAFGEAVRAGMVADLTELWTQTGLMEAVPLSVQNLSAYDGKQYYLPVALGWEAMYYNKQVFAQYGLEPPQTWEDFLVICDTLLANGEIPLAISGSEPWGVYQWFEYLNLRMNGPAFYRDLLAGKERYDDPRVRAVLETWRSLFVNGYFVEDRQTIGSMDMVTALVRDDKGMLRGQKAVMALVDTYNVGSLPAVFQEELDFFRFPIMDSLLPVAEVVSPFGYVVPMGAEHLPATMSFLTHVSSPEAQGAVAQQSMFEMIVYTPARADVAAERMTAKQSKVSEMLQNSAEAVLPLWAAIPRQMFGLVSYDLTRFAAEPHDIDRFIQKFEEARQKMVDEGVLLVE